MRGIPSLTPSQSPIFFFCHMCVGFFLHSFLSLSLSLYLRSLLGSPYVFSSHLFLMNKSDGKRASPRWLSRSWRVRHLFHDKDRFVNERKTKTNDWHQLNSSKTNGIERHHDDITVDNSFRVKEPIENLRPFEDHLSLNGFVGRKRRKEMLVIKGRVEVKCNRVLFLSLVVVTRNEKKHAHLGVVINK